MGDSSVQLNPGSGGAQVRTVSTDDTLSKTPDQGYTETQQQVVVIADEDGDTDSQTVPRLLLAIFERLGDMQKLLEVALSPDDVHTFDDDNIDQEMD